MTEDGWVGAAVSVAGIFGCAVFLLFFCAALWQWFTLFLSPSVCFPLSTPAALSTFAALRRAPYAFQSKR